MVRCSMVLESHLRMSITYFILKVQVAPSDAKIKISCTQEGQAVFYCKRKKSNFWLPENLQVDQLFTEFWKFIPIKHFNIEN